MCGTVRERENVFFSSFFPELEEFAYLCTQDARRPTLFIFVTYQSARTPPLKKKTIHNRRLSQFVIVCARAPPSPVRVPLSRALPFSSRPRVADGVDPKPRRVPGQRIPWVISHRFPPPGNPSQGITGSLRNGFRDPISRRSRTAISPGSSRFVTAQIFFFPILLLSMMLTWIFFSLSLTFFFFAPIVCFCKNVK